MTTKHSQIAGLAAWVGICFLTAWAGALVSPGIAPADWYDALNKPPWTPPDWVFGPVWTLLYLLMGIAAWIVWKTYGFRLAGTALGAFLVQLALNGAWSWIFFYLQAPGWAFLEIILLFIAIAVTTRLFFRKSGTAGWLMVPYMIWVGYAATLNGAIWVMN